MRYLVNAANDISSILSSTLEPSRDDIVQVLAIACNTLTRLANDQCFEDALQEVINRRDENRSNFEEAIEDVRHFTEDFMQVEKDLLLKAGLTEEAANALIDEGRRLRDSIRNSREHSANVLRNIVTLEQQVCDAAAQMIDVERAKSTLKRAFFGSVVH